MKYFIKICILFAGLTIFAVNQSVPNNYRIDGYVIHEDNHQPVIHQIVEIRDHSGGNIVSFTTNHDGLYSGNFNIDPLLSPSIRVEVTKNCGDSLSYYSQSIQLNNLYLTCNFLVCNNQPCHANFNVVQSSPNNLAFEFTDISKGNISTWFWEFGDGQTSNDQNPIHQYAFPDHYNVKLTISGKNCADSKQKPVFAFTQDCLSKFSFEQINQNGEISVRFTDLSIGNINNWFWEFGDETNSNIQNPVHQYNQPGEYEVRLSIMGFGCNHFSRQTVIVEPGSVCYPLFNTYQEPDVSMKILFTDLSIGTPDSWFWEFGDGQTSDQQNPVHIYQDPGDYEISLKITGMNCDAVFTRDLLVIQDTSCTTSFTFFQPSILEPVIQFENQSPGENLLFFWDFGDGSTSQDTSPLHEYPFAGIFEVKLKRIAYGCSDSIVKQVEVIEPIPCFADFSFQSAEPTSTLVSFTNQSTGMIYSFNWQFGDGAVSVEENPVHQYSQPGTYIVKLVIEATGCQDSTEKIVVIEEPAFCDAVFTYTQEYPQSRLIVFNNQSVGTAYSSFWDFGDDVFSNDNKPQHQYAAPGQYQVKLKITTEDDCVDSLSQTIDIQPPLVIKGRVFAGINLLSIGQVYLFNLTNEGNVELAGQFELVDGNFEFPELIPGNYFLEAIPGFNFPFPVIPNYFPTYSGNQFHWTEASIISTGNIPELVDLNLLHNDDFFDGDAQVSGKIIQTGTKDEKPLVLFLFDETDNLKDFYINNEDGTFAFTDIPIGSYKLFPEKAGKTGQSFTLLLSNDKPEIHNVTFIENSSSILPDLTGIDEQILEGLSIYPNPAGNMVNIALPPGVTGRQMELEIISTTRNTIFRIKPEDPIITLDISNYVPGVYFIRFIDGDKIICKKLIVK